MTGNLIRFLVISLLLFNSFAKDEYLCTTKSKSTIRSAPTVKSARVKSLARYSPLKKKLSLSNWYQVEGVDFSGYIHKSLVTDKYKCMTLLSFSDPYCSEISSKLDRKITYRESFKIIKQEIACNYAQDKWGKKVWFSSANIWPKEHAKLIVISP